MILVTGAGGFVGRSLMRVLEEDGRPVRAYEGRMNDPLRLREELAGIQIVFHLAGAEARGRPRLLQHVDVEGTQRLVEETRRAAVQHLVYLSRLQSDANSLYPLLRAKGHAERIVRHSGIPYTIVRSATLFGLDDRFLNVIAGLAAWSWPFVWLPRRGEALFQPLWVEDLVRCLALLPDRSDLRGETVDIAGEERVNYSKLVQLVLEAADLNRIPLPLDLRLVRPTAKLSMGWWYRPPVTPFFLDRFSVPDVAPVDSVLRTFGFRPVRMIDHMAYLRRPELRRSLFRL
jgi:NADH dehydrogenase